MSPSLPAGIRRLLAIRLDNIGDVVMLSPVLRELKRTVPSLHVTLMASHAGGQIAPMLPWVDDLFVHEAVWQDVSGAIPQDQARELALVKELETRNFDAALIFTSFSQSPYPAAYACYLAGIAVRVGQSSDFGGGLLSHWVKPLPHGTHQVDRNLHLLESVGVAAEERSMEIRVPPEVDRSAMELLHSVGVDPNRPFLAMAPGASCAARSYPSARFAAAARMLAEESRLPVVLLGSEREESMAPAFTEAPGPAPRIASLIGRTTVSEFAAVIRQASLVICNNSAAMHLADAFQRPALVLFSGTDLEEQWRPRRTASRLLRISTSCSPCYRMDCPYDLACLDISPEVVTSAAMDLLTHTSSTVASAIGVAGGSNANVHESRKDSDR